MKTGEKEQKSARGCSLAQKYVSLGVRKTSVLLPERLGRVLLRKTLCTFGIRGGHGLLQNAIRFQSGVGTRT